MAESTQHKLDRVRPPRVHLTYDVEVGDAIQLKELPFIVGILSDLSGSPEEALPFVKERKFTEIDRDNFNEVLASSKPRLALRVENKLTDEGSMLNAELKFSEIDDFDPVRVIKQIDPLRKLFEARQRLSDLIGKLDGNDSLENILQDVVKNTEDLQKLKSEAAPSTAGTSEDDAGLTSTAASGESAEEPVDEPPEPSE